MKRRQQTYKMTSHKPEALINISFRSFRIGPLVFS